jgi:protein ImuA
MSAPLRLLSPIPPAAAALRQGVFARPDLWTGDSLARNHLPVLPTGHAALDAQLPGGGWPSAGLVELLLAHVVQHEWQLLLPFLAAQVQAHPGPVALVGAPPAPGNPKPSSPKPSSPMPGTLPMSTLMPFGPALAAQGLPPERLLWVQAAEPAARLWAAEQALRCADVVAVLAWLPQVRPDALRRLHLGAVEHNKPLFVLRPARCRHEASAAPLRLLLDGVDALDVQVLKRRGPPLVQAVRLPARGPRLAALLASRSAGQRALPVPASKGVVHALDRAVTA